MDLIFPKVTLMAIRFSLGLTFFWFGILKVFNSSPVTPLINSVSPFSFPLEIPLLGIFEVLLGLSFFTNRFTKITSMVMVVYLIGITILVLIGKGFSPWFPLLTLEGEFVVKNLVLVAAGFVILSQTIENK